VSYWFDTSGDPNVAQAVAAAEAVARKPVDPEDATAGQSPRRRARQVRPGGYDHGEAADPDADGGGAVATRRQRAADVRTMSDPPPPARGRRPSDAATRPAC